STPPEVPPHLEEPRETKHVAFPASIRLPCLQFRARSPCARPFPLARPYPLTAAREPEITRRKQRGHAIVPPPLAWCSAAERDGAGQPSRVRRAAAKQQGAG